MNVENAPCPPRVALIALAHWDIAALWPHRVGLVLSANSFFLHFYSHLGGEIVRRLSLTGYLSSEWDSGLFPRISSNPHIFSPPPLCY